MIWIEKACKLDFDMAVSKLIQILDPKIVKMVMQLGHILIASPIFTI